MSEVLLPYYEAVVKTADVLAKAQAAHDSARVALLSRMPEGEIFTTNPAPLPFIRRVGNELQVVELSSIHKPYEGGDQ